MERAGKLPVGQGQLGRRLVLGVLLASFARLAVLSVRIERELALLQRALVDRLVQLPRVAVAGEGKRMSWAEVGQLGERDNLLENGSHDHQGRVLADDLAARLEHGRGVGQILVRRGFAFGADRLSGGRLARRLGALVVLLVVMVVAAAFRCHRSGRLGVGLAGRGQGVRRVALDHGLLALVLRLVSGQLGAEFQRNRVRVGEALEQRGPLVDELVDLVEELEQVVRLDRLRRKLNCSTLLSRIDTRR